MTFQLDDLKPFIDWLHAHPGLAGLAVLIISCAESLAIIGLFIPGTIVMPAIGSMLGAGVLPAPLIISAAIIGAIIGDGVSYWLGHHYHSQIKAYWPFNRYPRLLKGGEQFFIKYGSLSVFIGRFVGPVRPIIPVVAGMMSMTPGRFLVANVSSAVAWAIVYMAPGYLLGAVSEQLAPHTAARLLVILAIVTLALWLLGWILKRLWSWLNFHVQRAAHLAWQRMSQPAHRLHRLYRCLLFPEHPASHKPLLFLLAALVSEAVFLVLLLMVQTNTWFSTINTPLYYILRSIELPNIDQAMAVVQAFATLQVYAVVLLVVGAYLAWQRRWRALICWVANFLSCWLFIEIFKIQVHVPRPANNILWFSNWSFPSLHGGLIISLYVGLVMLLLPRIHRRMWSKVVLGGCFFAFVAALPQLYFGFNWLSDELGGVVAAIFVGALWLLIYSQASPKARLPAYPLMLCALLSFIITGTVMAKVEAEQFLASLKTQAITIPFWSQAWWQGQRLPIHLVREDVFGKPVELLNIQYVGHLATLSRSLEAKGWSVAPKPSLLVILNRIGAKNRVTQLPLIPDLYQARKPVLVMTKALHNPEKMLVLRLWATTVMMLPMHQALWLGTIQYRTPWHFLTPKEQTYDPQIAAEAMLGLNLDLSDFLVAHETLSAAQCATDAALPTCDQPVLLVRSVAL